MVDPSGKATYLLRRERITLSFLDPPEFISGTNNIKTPTRYKGISILYEQVGKVGQTAVNKIRN
jgi:hypothetical protein